MESREDAILRALKEEMQKRGAKGGLARAKAMTPEQRRRSALKASRAAAEARKRMARLKKVTREITVGTKKLLRKSKAAEARLAAEKKPSSTPR